MDGDIKYLRSQALLIRKLIMSNVETSVPSPIAKLPIEIVQEILSNAADVEVLKGSLILPSVQ